jgi:hypothetical protein
MDHVKFRGKTEETLGVTDKKVAFLVKTTMELVDQALLLGLIEIDHHVAAEDHIVVLRLVFGF